MPRRKLESEWDSQGRGSVEREIVHAAQIASDLGRVSRLLAYRQADRASQFFGAERFEELLRKESWVDQNELTLLSELFRGTIESEELADLEAVRSYREKGVIPAWLRDSPPKREFPIYFLRRAQFSNTKPKTGRARAGSQ
jgi:hypothetical protein